MRVTVTETIEHSADITPVMVEAYLVRTEWHKAWDGPSSRGYERTGGWVVVVPLFASAVTETSQAWSIKTIARSECRPEHDVLRDVASGA